MAKFAVESGTNPAAQSMEREPSPEGQLILEFGLQIV